MTRKTLKEEMSGPTPIETAAGKDLLKALTSEPSAERLLSFYLVRRNWCGGHPHVPFFVWSFGAFDDVPPAVDAATCVVLLPLALELAMREPWETIACAFTLIEALLRKHPIRPVPGLADAIVRLRPNAIRATLVASESYWKHMLELAQPLLLIGGDACELPRSKYAVWLPSWKTLLPMPMKREVELAALECPVPDAEIESEAQAAAKCGVKRSFTASFAHEDSLWWVWRCEPIDPKWIYVPRIFVRKSAKHGTSVESQHYPNGSETTLVHLAEYIAIAEGVRRREAVVGLSKAALVNL